MINTNDLRPGAVIHYKLLPQQRPVNPDRLWMAKIKRVHRTRASKEIGICWVEPMEGRAYEGVEDIVEFPQIVDIICPA